MFSQAITRSMLLGIAKYRLLNMITMAHAIVVSVAVTVAGLNSGVLAICIAISVTSAIAAMAHLLNGCAALNCSVWNYVRVVLIPAVSAALIAAATWRFLRLAPAEDIFTLAAHIALFSVLFTLAIAMLNKDVTWALVRKWGNGPFFLKT
jgi:hypothetical protein